MSKQPGNTEGAAVSQTGSLGVGTIWRGARRHPMLTALTVVLSVVGGCAIWFFLPLPKMTAYVIFQIAAQPQTLLSAVGDSRADFSLYCQTQSALIKSRQVLNSALNQPGIANLDVLRSEGDKIYWLENKLKVDFKTSPEFMRLSMEGDEGDDMKSIIEAIKTVYIEEVRTKDSMQRLRRLHQLEEIQHKYDTALGGYQKKLKEVADDLGSTVPQNLAVKEKFAQEQLGQAQRELLQIQSDMRRATVESSKYDERAKNVDEASVPKELIDNAIKSDPEYRRLLAKEAAINEAIKGIKADIRPGVRPPALTTAEDDLAKTKKEITDYAEKIRPAIANDLKQSAVVESKKLLATVQDRMAVWDGVKKAIEADIERISGSIRKASTGQLDVEAIRRDMSRLERTSDIVRQQIEELNPELAAPSRVNVWEDPVVVAGIEGNRRLKYSALALCGLLFVGFSLITYVEAKNRHVVAAKDVSEDLGMRLIGTVPTIPRRSKREKDGVTAQMAMWQSALTESVDATRTMLVHSLQGAKSGVSIVVTSAMPEEGKTMFASHIASSLSRAGFKTLLVDGDMRRPSLNRIFDVPLTPGLCELLRGECAPNDAIRPCMLSGLSIVPAGNWDPRVSQALSTDRWRILKTQLASGFDYVVIDTSPLLLVTDPLLMAQHADGVVISVLRNVSQIELVTKARDRLTSLGVKILGVVVSGLDQHSYRPYYRDYLRSNTPVFPAIAAPSDDSIPNA